jgi:acyl transferase domain-containing protein
MDPQQRLLLEITLGTKRSKMPGYAGITLDEFEGSDTSVYAGTGDFSYCS